MKTEKEIKAFVTAYANCMGYVDSPTVEIIALMLSAAYDEGVIADRFDDARSVMDAYCLWDQAKATKE
jgi:hypothetical protein